MELVSTPSLGSLIFRGSADLDDLRRFLERLERAGSPEVRLLSRDDVLAVYGCTQAPRGLTDGIPVVLVMRGWSLAETPVEPVDVTVLARSLLDRLARISDDERELVLPDVTAMAAWTGVLPPVEGWRSAGEIDAGSLARVAREGSERVAAALPDNPGEAVVHKVRSSVWGLEMAPGIPAAAAFAAETMGFLSGAETLRVSRTVTWVRLSSGHGHVVVRALLG